MRKTITAWFSIAFETFQSFKLDEFGVCSLDNHRKLLSCSDQRSYGKKSDIWLYNIFRELLLSYVRSFLHAGVILATVKFSGKTCALITWFAKFMIINEIQYYYWRCLEVVFGVTLPSGLQLWRKIGSYKLRECN